MSWHHSILLVRDTIKLYFHSTNKFIGTVTLKVSSRKTFSLDLEHVQRYSKSFHNFRIQKFMVFESPTGRFFRNSLLIYTVTNFLIGIFRKIESAVSLANYKD